MKKLIAIVLLLVSVLTASAQGKWSTGATEADELKGVLGGPYYRYDVEGMGAFILWDWEDWDFKIQTDNGTFDVLPDEEKKSHFILFTMGLYSLEDKLIMKFNDALEADHIDMKSAWMNKKWTHYIYDRKKIKKMFKTTTDAIKSR